MEINNESDWNKFVEKFFSRGEILDVLRSSGRTRSSDDLPILEIYLKDTNDFPFTTSYDNLFIDMRTLEEELDEMGAKNILRVNECDSNGNELSIYPISMWFRLQKGYYIGADIVILDIENLDPSKRDYLIEKSYKKNYTTKANVRFLSPPKNSSIYDADLERKIVDMMMRIKVDKREDVPCIGMICKEKDFYIKDFVLTGDYTINNSNLHYGPGFEEFHDELLKRFQGNAKGLVLFHGEPGTGKTHFIRSLMKDLLKIDKQILYFPSNMINLLLSPEIMTFLSSELTNYNNAGKSCILLLEDAEPLLVSRNSGRSEGITNLLNITDGLLNNILNVQVIATFNTDLRNIDEALLRPERLIARKEFKKLSIEDSRKLCELIGVENIDREQTLAEIYARKKKSESLIHEYGEDAKKIGF